MLNIMLRLHPVELCLVTIHSLHVVCSLLIISDWERPNGNLCFYFCYYPCAVKENKTCFYTVISFNLVSHKKICKCWLFTQIRSLWWACKVAVGIDKSRLNTDSVIWLPQSRDWDFYLLTTFSVLWSIWGDITTWVIKQ